MPGPSGHRLVLVGLLVAVVAASALAPGASGEQARGKGIEALAQEVREAPGDVDRLLRLARAYEKAGRQAEAVASFRQALEHDASNLEARQALERLGAIGWSEGEVLSRADEMLALGRLREAAYLYERFLKDHPESERARSGLARSRPADSAASTSPAPAAATAPSPAADPEPDRAPAVATRTVGESARAAAAPAEPEGESRVERAPTALPAPSPARSPASQPRTTVGAPGSVTPPAVGPDASSSGGAAIGMALLGVVLLAGGILVALRLRRRGHATMSGDLAMMSLADVLQFLGLGARTGVLEVSASPGAASIFLEAGRIRGAMVGATSGLPTLFDALGWRAGSFRFVERALPTDCGERIDLPVQEALLEWAAREDVAHQEAETAMPPSLLDQIDDDTLNRQLPF